ncbi:MAG: hypothetical protein PS018_11570 [bacterium]|nr:hypothetical protein [bacterium]
MTHLTAPLAEPYTPQELIDFEQLIFASNNPDHKIRLAARVALADFFREHGKTKCDLMMEVLDRRYSDKRPDA